MSTQEVKVLFENGDCFYTIFKGTEEDVKNYYIGKIFNIGVVDDNMQKCVDIELQEKVLTEQMINDSDWLSQIQKKILCTLLETERAFPHFDPFVTPNETALYDINYSKLLHAMFSLVNLGILKRRECEGLAFEWNDKYFSWFYL